MACVSLTNLLYSVSERDKAKIHKQKDLEKLLRKAEAFDSSPIRRCLYFYRDKNRAYFSNIRQNDGGTMKVYRKDFHGDPKSPINGRMCGLFFCTNVEWEKDTPVQKSIFGDTRLMIPMEKMYEVCSNLWFTDFYCVFKPHYVTLVMTKPGSDSDRFCREHLVQLDWKTNCFLRRVESDDLGVIYKVSTSMWVEVMYTENLNISDQLSSLQRVPMTGQRTGGTTGLKKKTFCSTCNI
jgi:hypothetical protein